MILGVSSEPGLVENVTGTDVAWTNPEYAQTFNEGRVAEAIVGVSPDRTLYLRATQFDLSAIPVGNIITGIEPNVWGWTTFTEGSDCRVQMLKAGVLVGMVSLPALQYDAGVTPHKIISCGGCSCLWEESWIRSDLLDPTFGFQIRVEGPNRTNRIDFLGIIIYHKFPASAPDYDEMETVGAMGLGRL